MGGGTRAGFWQKSDYGGPHAAAGRWHLHLARVRGRQRAVGGQLASDAGQSGETGG